MKPYNPNACCGADCFALYMGESEPCWGDVSVASEVGLVDEDGNPDYYWVHECEGHAGCFEDGEKYKSPIEEIAL